MKRQRPDDDLRDTEEKARTAVLSRGLDSAAAEGWRTPPARLTGTADVGLAVACAASTAAGETEEMDAAEVTATEEAEREETAMGMTDEECVIVTIVVEVQLELELEASVEVGTSEIAEETAVEVATTEAAVVEAETAAALLPPKVKDWVEAPEQAAESRTLLEVTVKQVPASLRGARVRGPEPPVKLKSCELVTAPPPSARPPQENMMTVFPAARRGSKFMHAWVKVLTTSIVPAWSSCFPAVMTSHCWPWEPSHAPTWIGFRLARKSPESSLMKRHCPSDVLISVLENALVAVSSLCWASSKAAVFNAVTVLTSIGFARANAAEVRRRESDAIILKNSKV